MPLLESSKNVFKLDDILYNASKALEMKDKNKINEQIKNIFSVQNANRVKFKIKKNINRKN